MNHALDEEQRPAGSLVPSAAVALATLAFFRSLRAEPLDDADT